MVENICIIMKDTVSTKVYSFMERIMGSEFNKCGIKRNIIPGMIALGRSPVE